MNDPHKIIYYFVGGGFLSDAPTEDITAAFWDGLPKHIQKSIASSPFYKKAAEEPEEPEPQEQEPEEPEEPEPQEQEPEEPEEPEPEEPEAKPATAGVSTAFRENSRRKRNKT